MSSRTRILPGRLSRFAALATIVLGFAGCKVGPNYSPPETKVPEGWDKAIATDAASQPSVAAPGVATIEQWWTTFNDPVLNSLVERGVRANPDLRRAQARVREARALRGVIASDLYPTVNVGESISRSSDSNNTAFAGPGFGGAHDLYQVGFDAAWELDVFGGVRRNVEAADADIAFGIEDRRDVLISLLAEIARNYVELRGSQRLMVIAQANLELQQATLDITRIRLDAGLASDLDVARAEAQVQTTAATLPLIESSARQSVHLLSVLIGLEPTALSDELSQDAPIPAAPPQIPIGLPSELLRRRPDVRRAERQLASATARIGVATADLFPKFSLTGTLGFSSAKTSNLFDSDSRFWSLGQTLQWPLLDFGRIRSNIAVQNAREEQAAIVYEQAVLTSLREVQDALVSFATEQSRRETLVGARDANKRAVDLASQLYQQGATDFLSVIQAQRDLSLSEDALVRSERLVASDLVALYKALGGGWELESQGDGEPVQGKAGARTFDVTSAPAQESP